MDYKQAQARVKAVKEFIVKDKKGPLKEGELERAKKWAMEVSKYD